VAVRIRLRRTGKKKEAHYRLVVAEAAGPRDGRFIEAIGYYNPRVDPPTVRVEQERALWWLQHGAQPSETARSMLVKSGVWERFTGEPRPAPVERGAAERVAAEAGIAEAPTPSPATETAVGAAEEGPEDSPKDGNEESLAEGAADESEQVR